MDEDKSIAHVLDVKPRTEDVRLSTLAPFSKMILSNALRKGLHQAGYIRPTVIQAAAIPIGKAGIDLLVQSKSGTGKTLIFCCIILENYDVNIKEPQSLIIAPTREIAVQIEDVINVIGRFVNGFRAVCVIGGLSAVEDRKRLQGAKCIVGTPGRVLHLIENNVLNTNEIHILVLDEADKMYTQSFRKDLLKLQNVLTARTQTIACSATFCNNLDKELAKMMLQPVFVSTEKGNAITGLLGIKQFVYDLCDTSKNLTISIFEMLEKRDALNYIFRQIEFKQCILFSRSQSRAESYCNYLKQDGWPCEFISGAQSQKRRLETMRNFRDSKFRILLTTDLLSRGIDLENVNLIINLELPQDMATYLHRIGRAGRFGSHGIAISFLATENDKQDFNKILKEMKSDLKILKFPQKNITLHKEKEIDFWNFSCPDREAQHYGLYNDYKNEEETPPSLSDDISLLTTNATSATTSDQSSIDTKTFQIDSKDSAINMPILKQINGNDSNNDDNVEIKSTQQHHQQQLTQSNSQHDSSQCLVSSNTIDDASSIAADSLRSCNQSMILSKSQKLNLLKFLIDNEQPQQITNYFDKCTKEILNDNHNHSTTTHTESSSNSDNPLLSSQRLLKLKSLLIDKSASEEDGEKKHKTLLPLTSSSDAVPMPDIYDDFANYVEKEKHEDDKPEEVKMNNNNDNNNDKSYTDEFDGNTFVLSATTPSIEPQDSLSRVIGEVSIGTTIKTNESTVTTTATSSSSSSCKCDGKHYTSPMQSKSVELSQANMQQHLNLSRTKTTQIEIPPHELSSEESVSLPSFDDLQFPNFNNGSESDTKSSGFDEAIISNGNVAEMGSMSEQEEEDVNDSDDNDDYEIDAEFLLNLSLNENNTTMQSVESAENENDNESLTAFSNDCYCRNVEWFKNSISENSNMPLLGSNLRNVSTNQSAYNRWIKLYWKQFNLIQDYVTLSNCANQQ